MSWLVGQGPEKQKMREYEVRSLGGKVCQFTFEEMLQVKLFVRMFQSVKRSLKPLIVLNLAYAMFLSYYKVQFIIRHSIKH